MRGDSAVEGEGESVTYRSIDQISKSVKEMGAWLHYQRNEREKAKINPVLLGWNWRDESEQVVFKDRARHRNKYRCIYTFPCCATERVWEQAHPIGINTPFFSWGGW